MQHNLFFYQFSNSHRQSWHEHNLNQCSHFKLQQKSNFFLLFQTSGRPDEVIAAETLANHVRCNNSFIQAIFQAQYRSSLSCSRCLTQSNTFDPFQCISVQLPQINRHSVYVTVLYTSQQPRQVKIGVSLPSGATVSELREVLQLDTSIDCSNMLLTEIGDSGFMRTFTDAQSVSIITEIDPVYCIEVAQLKDVEEDSTSAYILLCWINVVVKDGGFTRFGMFYVKIGGRYLQVFSGMFYRKPLHDASVEGYFVWRSAEAGA